MLKTINNKVKVALSLLVAIMVCITNVIPVAAATKEVPITSVNFPTSVTLKVGEVKTLEVKTNPSNTTYKTNIEWGYQTNGRFTNKDNGCGTYWNELSSETLTGTSAGTGYLYTTVKVYNSTGNYIKKFDVKTVVTVTNATTTVPKKVPLQKITLNKAQASVQAGSSMTLSVAYTPSNTTDNKSVYWSTSNSSVATVSGGRVTAKKAGTATISAKVGTKAATCKVIVTAKSATNNNTQAKPTVVKNTEGYVNVPEAYSLLNKFRTTKNVWQWNSNNKSKTYFNTNSKNKLSALKKDAALEKTAKVRAKEIASKYSHTRPNGKSCYTAYPSYSYKGENIAYGYTTATEVTEVWKETNKKYAGQTHRRNMLNKSFNVVGIACYQKGGTKYWVQCFGRK